MHCSSNRNRGIDGQFLSSPAETGVLGYSYLHSSSAFLERFFGFIVLSCALHSTGRWMISPPCYPFPYFYQSRLIMRSTTLYFYTLAGYFLEYMSLARALSILLLSNTLHRPSFPSSPSTPPPRLPVGLPGWPRGALDAECRMQCRRQWAVVL